MDVWSKCFPISNRVIIQLKKYILIIFIILLTSLCYADTYMSDSTFTPTLRAVTYNLSRNLVCDTIWVDQYCFNITGGVDAHNYCNLTGYIYILDSPHIIPEPTTNITILEPNNYTINVSSYDTDEESITIEWYVNNTNITDYYNYTTYNFTGNDTSSGSYNITIISYDVNGSSSFEWILTVSEPVTGGEEGTTGPPGKSGYSPEEKCELIGGLWLLNEDKTYYCKLVSKPEYWVNKIGAVIWPSYPIWGLVAAIIVLYLILATFGSLPKWLILFKDKDEEEKEDKKEEDKN